eukprot:TRINITY_DN11726_c0_g1_i2.p1 TRINITY_DN11726_c0_g1~~TRINITY_DN11726_c0_g1_i2.p1  ORF type:complete len:629 (+),score=140.95 TRINITY_DN11726_c0_g1_i2:172-2058(+)
MRARTFSRYRGWIIGIFFIPLFFILYTHFAHQDFSHSFDPPTHRIKPNVQILVYDDESKTKWYSTGSESWIPPFYLNHMPEKSCPSVRECSVTTDQSKLGYSDAVVIEGKPRNPSRIWDWVSQPEELPQKRPGQVWVNFGFHHRDSYPILREPGYKDLFDIDMTFNQNGHDTNVPTTLFCDWDDNQKNLKQTPSGSRSGVAFFSNNCAMAGAKNRTLYVKELMKYIEVDSYGECLHNKDLPKDVTDALYGENTETEGAKKLVELLSKYKFVLAFENANITDYVTEKVYLALKSGAVPVYMGAPNVLEWLPKDSFVSVERFKSPKDLADHLKELERDSGAYDAFHAWRKRDLPGHFKDKIDKCVLNSECRLCDAVAQLQLKQEPNYITGIDKEIVMDKSYALQFDGQSTYVEIADQPELRLSESFTLTAWIKVDVEISDYRVVDKNTAGTIDGFSMDVLKKANGRGFLRFCGGGGCWNTLTPLFAGKWYHVAVSYVSSNAGQRLNTMAGVFFYINGELDYEVTFPSPMYGQRPARKNNLPLRIGRAGAGNNFWRGVIDDVAIWNVPLDSNQLRRLMFERLGGKEPGLVAYYSFNEGQGDRTIDHSPARRDATVYAGRWIPSEKKELDLS